MNYFLVTRHEVVTKQIVIRYVPDNQRLVVILPEEDFRIATFDVPWADNAFFDTLANIGICLVRSMSHPIKTVVAYENDSGIVVGVNDNRWTFDKRSQLPKGDPKVFKPTGEKFEGAFVADELGPTNYPKGDTNPT